MASFRTHVSVGVACGVLCAFAITDLALVPESWSFSILIGLAVTLGAQLPDMDSDSGLPFHITFSSLSLVAAALTGLYVWQNYPGNYSVLIIAPLVAFVFTWGVIGTLFKRFTKHRGMAHSVPAAVLAGLVTFAFASWLGFIDWQAFLLGIAISIGFVVHLILDELWAGFNFHGKPFVPNKAFGSALKFTSHDHRLTAVMYVVIAVLVYINLDNFQTLSVRLVESLTSAS